jgi:hypothetical protein
MKGVLIGGLVGATLGYASALAAAGETVVETAPVVAVDAVDAGSGGVGVIDGVVADGTATGLAGDTMAAPEVIGGSGGGSGGGLLGSMTGPQATLAGTAIAGAGKGASSYLAGKDAKKAAEEADARARAARMISFVAGPGSQATYGDVGTTTGIDGTAAAAAPQTTNVNGQAAAAQTVANPTQTAAIMSYRTNLQGATA